MPIKASRTVRSDAQPDLNYFKDDRRGVGHGDPDTNFFDGQIGPGVDENAIISDDAGSSTSCRGQPESLPTAG